jgi:hypothetical protein
MQVMLSWRAHAVALLTGMSRPKQSEPGVDALTVEALAPRVILTTFIGKSSEALSEVASRRFFELLESMDRPVWISDARRLTGFEPRSLTLGPRWFAAFRARGGEQCLVISQWKVAIMAASTMALGLGVRVRACSTLDDALSVARPLLA